MNEAKVYEDGFQAVFTMQDDFLQFLSRIGDNSSWLKSKVKNLKVVALNEEEKIAASIMEQYAKDGREDIVTDTLNGTGLALKAKNEYIPVRDCAIKSIQDRAGISGSGLKRVGKKVFARIINDCLKAGKGEALIRLSEGKISAVLGGDCSDYSILDMEEIYGHTVEYLDEHYKGCKYVSGYYEHDMVSALWMLEGEDKLLEAYRKEAEDVGVALEEMIPIVRVTTSDTGNGGANIYPLLAIKNTGKVISLGSPLKLHHRAGADIREFDNQLSQLYGKYQLAAGNLKKLLHVCISNPVNCMMGVMKKLGISHKLTMEAVELFKAQYGEEPCRAHDIYLGISEILFMLECDGEKGSKLSKMEEIVARALSINWHEFDIPGTFKW